MKYQVPFNYERTGGFNNLVTGTPLAYGGNMLFFQLLASKGFIVSSEYLVNVDRYGNVINRYRTLINQGDYDNGYINTVLTQNGDVLYNSMATDVVKMLTSRGTKPPCGYYYYEVYLAGIGRLPIPVNMTYWNNPTEPQYHHYKTEVFRIDSMLSASLVPKNRGDFDETDFGWDFYIGA